MEIYKYLDAGGAEGFLTNWCIAFKTPQNFNDPFDCMPVYIGKPPHERTIDIERNAVARFERNLHETIEDARRYAEWEFNFFERQHIADLNGYIPSSMFYVTCMSRTDSNLLMWAHYASQRTGIVVEFDRQHPLLAGNLRHVIYSQKRPRVDIHATTLSLGTPHDFQFVKSLDWAYEQEERIVLNVNQVDSLHRETGIDLQGKNFRLVRLGKEAVKSITFSYDFIRKHRKGKIEELMSDPDCQHIELKVAMYDAQEFKINCVPSDQLARTR